MEIDYVSVFIFACVTTFTPGPNTIRCAIMGMQAGYKRSMPYFLGIATGFFSIMLICGIFVSLVAHILPEIMQISGSGLHPLSCLSGTACRLYALSKGLQVAGL